MISPNATSSISPLESSGSIYNDEQDKANPINIYFKEQTFEDECHAGHPDLPECNVASNFEYIFLTPLDVEYVLKMLPIGKASVPKE